MDPDELDPDVIKYRAAARNARNANVGKALKLSAILFLSVAVGGAAAFAIARHDEAWKEARLESYKRGGTIVVKRGESPYDTSPSFMFPAMVGIGIAATLFAVGAGVFLKDKTYLRGLAVFAKRE